jgi:hypothetical protein
LERSTIIPPLFLGLNIPTHMAFPGHTDKSMCGLALAGNVIHTPIQSAFLAKLSYFYIKAASHIRGGRRKGRLSLHIPRNRSLNPRFLLSVADDCKTRTGIGGCFGSFDTSFLRD